MRLLITTLILFSVFIINTASAQEKPNIVYLSLDEVVGIAKTDNLSLKSKILDYETQNLEVWKSYSNFLPTFSYQGFATNNLELPVFVFMGQRFVVGTKYSFQHGLDLTLPLFTGGSRWFNMQAQRSLKKSLREELNGKEQETVLLTLQAYYGIILANSLYETTLESVEAAKANLKQVNLFYDAGTATQLDLQRAKAQYASTLPKLERARSEKALSSQRLKFLLNIPMEDSLVISDTLKAGDFLMDLKNSQLKDFKNLSAKYRTDIQSLGYKLEATEEGENVALGQFLPTIALSGNVSHQAQMENSDVRWNDYIRSKALTLSMSWPLFEGGRKVIEVQEAKIRTKQMKILYELADDQRLLDVEESYSKYIEAIKNLSSLEEAEREARESLRLSDLLYGQGMSTQLDVINAQLFYTSSKTEYYTGIFNYNTSQLQLLYSVGLLNKIWN